MEAGTKMETEKPTGERFEHDARPLWTCPHCGHRFVAANMWHSCSNYTLEQAFAGSTPELRQAFERFVQLVERCGQVTVIAQRTRIVLQARVRFAGATVLRDRLRLNFALARKHDAPWLTKIESYGPRWNAHHFEIRQTTDLDALAELPALLCESYNDLLQQRALHRE